jgi:glycerol-3-phosphate cytidylyltransferase
MKTFNIGVIAGNFDVIHPGYVAMFKECQSQCEQFFILLHDDPSVERPEKLKPVLSVKDRRDMLTFMMPNVIILTYNTESELEFLLKSIDPDVRFLGDDYFGKSYTGIGLAIPIHYINRGHGWSTTKFKNLIANEVQRSSNI